MLGACGDHGLVEDGDSCIGCKDLTFLLFPSVLVGKGETQVDAGMEAGHVVIQIRLANFSIGDEDMHDKGAEMDGVETFGGVLKNSVVDVVNRRRELVARDGEDHVVAVPCLTCGGVGGMQFLAFGHRGTGWDDWVGGRFYLWGVKR
jgi:hypothetical protein